MSSGKSILIKTGKIVLGTVLGLVLSFFTIVLLEVLLPKPNPFMKSEFNVWLASPIIAFWLFLFIRLLLRKPLEKRIHTQGMEQLPVPASELIHEISRAMRYRRSVRADVQRELVDHFTDALADCRSEEEKQKRAKELIAEFGDPQLLGILLRRAKKRCRPLWRTMAVRAFQLTGLLLILLILYIGWFFTGRPSVTTDYLQIWNEQTRPAADESLNAWPLYREAAQGYVEIKDLEFPKGGLASLAPQSRALLKQAVEANQKSLELVRLGNRKPLYWQTYTVDKKAGNNELLGLLIPDLAAFRNLGRLLCAEGLDLAEQGRLQEAADSIFEAYLFGQHIRGRNTTLIEQLVAGAMESIATQSLRVLLNQYGRQMEPQLLETVRKRFEAIVNGKDFTANFQGERLFLFDEAQRSFTQSRFGKSHLYLPRVFQLISYINENIEANISKAAFHVLFTHPGKEETLQTVDRFYSQMAELARLTPAQRRREELSLDEITQKAMEGNVLLNIMLPALHKVIENSWRNCTDSRATLTLLAIWEYEKKNGTLPDTLKTAVEKGCLKEVPLDPFSGQPLIYKKTSNGFILYSVGSDFIDNDGTPGKTAQGGLAVWPETGDAVFWPVSRE